MFVYVLQDDEYGSDGFWSVYSTGQKAQEEFDTFLPERQFDFSIYRVRLDGPPSEWWLWMNGRIQFRGEGEWEDETCSGESAHSS